MTDPRRPTTTDLDALLLAARAAMLECCLDLDDEQWQAPYSWNVQPVAWDLGHVGWFHEFWQLRGGKTLGPDGFQQAELGPAGAGAHGFGPDEHYDSARVRHRDRWHMPLHRRDELLRRLQRQLDASRERLATVGADPAAAYFFWLGALHELMHVEARAWTRSFLHQPAPPGAAMPKVPRARAITVPAGEHRIGTAPGSFAFDNEHPEQTIQCAAFEIDSDPVRNDAFLAFVADDGYRRDELWHGEGRRWRDRLRPQGPQRWHAIGGGRYLLRHYDHWLELPADEPVVHVNAFEAEAYCRWAGRRLPRAHEWEIAAIHAEMQWGRSVWEWTADAFAPRPDFRPGPYTTYSAPWFHHQRELRGGAYTTHPAVHDHRYRNFFLPWRTDVFAGFRTAAALP